ncbi:hypothetical protein Cni_G20177 [Canna indica]|uniref:Uncharacterized protein n=1 Tax=Canna indica TaxID=4628 RepID=A0AAQ3QKI2_9LILI|nr:hypothetical protein Cni_G20177 [Canna indica]
MVLRKEVVILWNLVSLVDNIWRIGNKLEVIGWIHISRSRNVIAHHAAKIGINSNFERIWQSRVECSSYEKGAVIECNRNFEEFLNESDLGGGGDNISGSIFSPH